MNCASCGTPNEAGRKFCMECGSALARECPSCAAPNPAASKFCGECGSALTSAGDASVAGAPTPAGAATTERRLVSVLFLDLVGFTTLSETRDPEQVKNLVDGCFAHLAADIVSFGGRVDKVVGDAIVALFGAPVAHEDREARA